MMRKKTVMVPIMIAGLLVLLSLLFVASLFTGSVWIPWADVMTILSGGEVCRPAWRYIVMETRLPSALTAVLCGSALSVCGLLLQVSFRNPLAGPGIFGISNGAGLGVALVMLGMGGSVVTSSFSLTGYMAILLSALVGALIVTALILFLSTLVSSNTMLLIVGIMVGYLSSAAIALLNFSATAEGVRSFVMWGMGSFSAVSMRQMPVFAAVSLVGLVSAVLLVKPLNVLLLGDSYAEALGIRVRRVRHELLAVTGLLCAVVTSFCGPIAFLGLSVPHIARLLIQTENQRFLLPVTMLTGSVIALACHLACYWFGHGQMIPLNAVTPLVGAPVIIYVVMRSNKVAKS